MSEFCGELKDFKSFNDFFTRKIKPCARPFPKRAGIVFVAGGWKGPGMDECRYKQKYRDKRD